MNGRHKAQQVFCRWESRILNDGESAVVEIGDRAIAMLTGEDPEDCCSRLPSEEFVVPREFAKRLCELLNELVWYQDAETK